MIISSSLCLGHVYFLSLSEEKKEEWKHGGKVGTQQVRLTLLLLWLLKRNIVRVQNSPEQFWSVVETVTRSVMGSVMGSDMGTAGDQSLGRSMTVGHGVGLYMSWSVSSPQSHSFWRSQSALGVGIPNMYYLYHCQYPDQIFTNSQLYPHIWKLFGVKPTK